MNLELLREDELCIDFDHPNMLDTIELLRQRLIEAREKNAKIIADAKHGEEMYIAMRNRCASVEAELAEALRREQALLRLGAGTPS